MKIGDVIRENRKQQNLTQEKMANYLGVTAPAVNKWEKNHSLPDITLLAPIARLLNISLDTLLSFQETLSDEEINQIILVIDEKSKLSYADAFDYAKEKIKTYPNCYQLIWQAALILDAENVKKENDYESEIYHWYTRALASEEEHIRTSAANCLYHFHIRKNEYNQAQEYLEYFSNQNPLRKEMQAYIYGKTNRLEKAYQVYEQLLFSEFQMMNSVFNHLCALAQQEGEDQKVSLLIEKQCQLAILLDIGEYQAVAPKLELAASKQDVEMTIVTMQKMLKTIDTLDSFAHSPLYQHLAFKELQPKFVEEQRNKLKEIFRDTETFDYMKNEERWLTLIK